MDVTERLEETNTGVLIALAVGVAVVGLVVLVAVTVVLAAVVGTFVLGVGEEAGTGQASGPHVQAGASVHTDEDAGEVHVTWTSNHNADHLLVEWETSGGDVQPTDDSSGSVTEDGRGQLLEVGQRLRLAESDPGTETTVEVTVTAVADDSQAVLVTETVTL